jgi:hypothetical protein
LFVFTETLNLFEILFFSIFKRLGLQSSPSSDPLELRLLGGKQDMEIALFFVFLFKTWLVFVCFLNIKFQIWIGITFGTDSVTRRVFTRSLLAG